MVPSENAKAPVKVIIAGAGPAGCLAAYHLMLREVPYHVTLVDKRPDPSSIPLNLQRSWMIGLTTHGRKAVDRIPGLFDAIANVGLQFNGGKFYIGKRSMTFMKIADGLIVDRNWIVAGMMGHLLANNPHPDRLTCLWETKCLYIDPAAHTMTVQNKNGQQVLEYDLLIGCDGIRSGVRNAFLQDRNFQLELTDTFTYLKSVHIPCPADLETDYVHTIHFAWPNVRAILMPEVNGLVNVAAVFAKHRKCAPELFSKDPSVVEVYLRDNFTGPYTLDWKAFAQQWVAQDWNTTGQVKCSSYHLSAGRCLLMGDAAHATSPAIGSGMNTALADAAKFNDLLDQYDDDLDKVLPAFTKLRLKEGHALVDLSFHNAAFDPRLQLFVSLWQAAQSAGHRLTCGLIPALPLSNLLNGALLSEAYRASAMHGPLDIVRASNELVRRKWFERHSGLIPEGADDRGVMGVLSDTIWTSGTAVVAVAKAVATVVTLPLSLTVAVARQLKKSRPPPQRSLPTLPIPWVILKMFSLPWAVTKYLQMAPPSQLPDLRDATGQCPYTIRVVVPDQLWSVQYVFQPEPTMTILMAGNLQKKATQEKLLAGCQNSEAYAQMEKDIQSCLHCMKIPKKEAAKGGLLKAGMKIESHMLVAKLDDGEGLLLYSPVKVDDEIKTWLDSLGTVKWIVSPSSLHTLFVKTAAEKYPKAKVVAGLTGSVKLAKAGVKVDYNYGIPCDLKGLQQQLAKSFDAVALEADPLQELDLIHRPTRSLLICDLLYTNHPGGLLAQPELKEPDAWCGRLFFALNFTPEFTGGLIPTYRYHAIESDQFPTAPKPPVDAKLKLWPCLARLIMTPNLARVCSAHQREPLDPTLARQLLRKSWDWMQEDMDKEAGLVKPTLDEDKPPSGSQAQ